MNFIKIPDGIYRLMGTIDYTFHDGKIALLFEMHGK